MKPCIPIALGIVLMAALPVDAQEQYPSVVLETSLGPITLQLDQQTAPNTVSNFLNYVEKGFYDNTIFHRVIKGFMIQGGGLTQEMQSKPTDKPVQNEADNGLKNSVGTIAMARTPQPHSATSQFFINTADNVFLNHKAKRGEEWGYCVFGRVVEGMDVVRSIEKVSTTARAGHRDVPVEPIIITSARRVKPPASSAPAK